MAGDKERGSFSDIRDEILVQFTSPHLTREMKQTLLQSLVSSLSETGDLQRGKAEELTEVMDSLFTEPDNLEDA